MTKPSKTVLFFGSGPVAAKSLELLQKHISVEAVITKPSTLTEMTRAAMHSPVYAVKNKQELDSLITKESFKSNLGILIDFGIIVSSVVIDSFPLGIVNSHFSLLPEWRGADPITFAVLSGQQETGVSLMLLAEKMDEGPILAFEKLTTHNYTTPELTEKLVTLSDSLLQRVIQKYMDIGSTFPFMTQDSCQQQHGHQISYSRKLTKADGTIDWNKPAIVLEREIRAFIDWPKSRTQLAGKDIILTDASAETTTGPVGSISASHSDLVIHCAEGSLRIKRLKPASKREMSASEFLAGYRHLL